jgi:acetyltransferase-like isoleucine patch superfamily enzyme
MESSEFKILEFYRKIWNKKIIIFGFGRRGRLIAKYLSCDIAYYVDNDPAKWHVFFENKIVHNPVELLHEDKESIFIIVLSYYYKAIFWQLEEMGFREYEHFSDGLILFGDVLNNEVALHECKPSYDPKKVWLRGNPRIEGQCHFGGNNVILDDSSLIDSSLERYSTVGRQCAIRNTKVGQFCSIGSEVMIGLERHPTRGFVSTYGAFYIGKPTGIPSFLNREVFKEGLPTNIGNDVWIGTRALILGGVSVGDGAIIGAGAIVTKDVDPYSIVAGVPAKVLRKRYSAENIMKLVNFAWWNKDIEWIRGNAEAFNDEVKFFKIIETDS